MANKQKEKRQKPKSNKTLKPKKKVISIECKNFRLVKSDPLNWRIDKRNDKGVFTGSNIKGYYGNLEQAFTSLVNAELLTKKETKKFKELVEQLKKIKKEVRTLAKKLKKGLE